ncbi:hypothetical protein HKD37_07G018897 [Glycine soja]
MRCKKHLPDLTSTIGVCASCLRERLQPLLAAQAQSERSTNSDVDNNNHRRRKPKLKPEENPLPLNFPRSVSPYVTHRKSDCERRRERLFYGTPQMNAAACDGGAASENRRHGGRFWILSNLFRARSNKTETSPSHPPPSWFSTILHARRHNKCRHADRGLSPLTEVENFTEFSADTAQDRSDSGISSEDSPAKQNPTPETAHRRSRMGPAGKGLASMAFCLSPLVRAGPNRHWSYHNKGLAPELGVSGAHHISNAASFCANRSRKLADFGRGTHNLNNLRVLLLTTRFCCTKHMNQCVDSYPFYRTRIRVGFRKWDFHGQPLILLTVQNSKEEDFKCFRGKLRQKLEEKALKKKLKELDSSFSARYWLNSRARLVTSPHLA